MTLKVGNYYRGTWGRGKIRWLLITKITVNKTKHTGVIQFRVSRWKLPKLLCFYTSELDVGTFVHLVDDAWFVEQSITEIVDVKEVEVKRA